MSAGATVPHPGRLPITTARQIGEFGLIARVAARVGAPGPGVPVGIGDDAAVLICPDGRVVATTDVLIEGNHFRLDWSSPYEIGRRAAAANLADVAAMGGRATALLVGLVAPPDLAVADAEAMAEGLRDEAAQVGAAVIGGDSVAGDRLTLAVTALGDLAGRQPVLRSGATVGDQVVLAGRLGWSAAGLALLQAGVREGPLVAAHRVPQPPYAMGPTLADAGATSMCDVSDGLVADLGHIAAASGKRIGIRPADLSGEIVDGRALTLQEVLGGGEDHALVATLPPGVPPPAGCRLIGQVLSDEQPGVVVDLDSGSKLDVSGWDHFGTGQTGCQ
jgi:thiamine-monophosphate kinase